MATLRDLPYGNSRFVVEIDGIPDTAFAEVHLPELTESVVEYRDGNEKEGPARLLPDRPHVGRLLLRRGFRGSLALYQWWREVADGDPAARRNVSVRLYDEGMAAVVATWRLHRAWPCRYAVSPLRALGGDTLSEEVEVVAERVDLE